MPSEAAIGDQDRLGRQGAVQLAAEPRHMHWPVARIETGGRLFLPGRHAARDLGHILGAGRAGTRGVVGEALREILKAGAGVAPQRHLGGKAAADLTEMDYAAIARAMGVGSIRVEDPEQLGPALAQGMAERDRPTVLDVIVTRDPGQMLPAVDNRTLEIKQGDRVA